MDGATIVTSANLNKICRACLIQYEEMHSVFSEVQNEDNLEEEPVYLYEMLMNISSIRILAEDGLPSTICSNCMELAHTAFKFQQQCNRSQELLDTFFVNNKDCESKVEGNDEAKEVLDLLSASNNIYHNVENGIVSIEQNIPDEHDYVSENIFSTKCKTEVFEVDEQVLIKTEIKKQNDVDTIKDTSNVNNDRLRHRLAIKRIKNESAHSKKGNSTINCQIKNSDNGEKTYECTCCAKTYKHANSLKIHIRTHTLERPYICSHCGKGFKQYGALSYHLRSHTGEQPYECKLCGKRYRQSGTLTAHMRIHTGQRPFLCSVCGRGFRQAPDLGYHMRTHTKERPYMCSVCGKTMRMQCHLVQHMRIHTGERPFKCTECNKAFPSSTRLKRHAIIHTGLKPFKCDVCTKSFNRLSSLRVHSKIHTDERPHVCSFCGKGFIQAHALRGHLHIHVGENVHKSA